MSKKKVIDLSTGQAPVTDTADTKANDAPVIEAEVVADAENTKANDAPVIEAEVVTDADQTDLKAVGYENGILVDPKANLKANAPKVEKKNKKGKTAKVRFLLPPAGLFFLPYNVGQEVEMDELQAQEVVDAKYAEFVK